MWKTCKGWKRMKLVCSAGPVQDQCSHAIHHWYIERKVVYKGNYMPCGRENTVLVWSCDIDGCGWM